MYGIDKKINFHHHMNTANFSSKQKRWTMEVTANGTERKTYRSKIMLLCTGYYDYDNPLDAVIPGIEKFKGTVAHPQFWPEDMDYTDKEVIVIGSGATSVTIIPAMADKARHITMLQRSPSYLLSQPQEDGLERFIRSVTSWLPGGKALEHKGESGALHCPQGALADPLHSHSRQVAYHALSAHAVRYVSIGK